MVCGLQVTALFGIMALPKLQLLPLHHLGQSLDNALPCTSSACPLLPTSALCVLQIQCQSSFELLSVLTVLDGLVTGLQVTHM